VSTVLDTSEVICSQAHVTAFPVAELLYCVRASRFARYWVRLVVTTLCLTFGRMQVAFGCRLWARRGFAFTNRIKSRLFRTTNCHLQANSLPKQGSDRTGTFAAMPCRRCSTLARWSSGNSDATRRVQPSRSPSSSLSS